MMASNSLSFDAIVDALQGAGAVSDPAEMHGTLCGLACILGANAQSLWLAARIENRLGQLRARADLGQQLRRRFPESREATAYAQGRWDE